MNIVVIKKLSVSGLGVQQVTNRDGGYASLRDSLRTVGKVLVSSANGDPECYLVATADILVALAKSTSLRPEISIQVYSLTSPEGQLNGLVTRDNQSDPESYRLELLPLAT